MYSVCIFAQTADRKTLIRFGWAFSVDAQKSLQNNAVAPCALSCRFEALSMSCRLSVGSKEYYSIHHTAIDDYMRVGRIVDSCAAVAQLDPLANRVGPNVGLCSGRYILCRARARNHRSNSLGENGTVYPIKSLWLQPPAMRVDCYGKVSRR
jgi:hypothetical protein